MNSKALLIPTLNGGLSDPIALTGIYDDETNLAVWQRGLDTNIQSFCQSLCTHNSNYQARISGNSANIKRYLNRDLTEHGHKTEFVNDVELLVEMFCELLDINTVGLRLSVLSKAMCPKFHVDRVPARLITTYWGEGTQWLENRFVQRDQQGRVEVVGRVPVQQLKSGHVALMKGEAWVGNEGRGLVHRSPAITDAAPRLVLTLDCL